MIEGKRAQQEEGNEEGNSKAGGRWQRETIRESSEVFSHISGKSQSVQAICLSDTS